MIRAARAHLLLLRSRNYLLAGVGATSLLAFVTVMLNVGETEPIVEERGPLGESMTLDQLQSVDGLGLALGTTITMAGILLMAVGATAVASEYRTGVIHNLLIRQPNRIRLLVGKTLALAGAIVVVTAAMAVTTAVAAVAFTPEGTDTAVWFSEPGLRSFAASCGRYYLAALGWALFGQALATLTRSSVVSLAAGVVVAIPLDMILTDTVERSRRWLPGQLFQAVARGGTRHLEYTTSVMTIVAGGTVAVAVSIIVFHYRDITS